MTNNLDSVEKSKKNNPNSPIIKERNISLISVKNTKIKSKLNKTKFFLILFSILFLFLISLFVNQAINFSEKIFKGQKTTVFGKVWEVIRGASGKITLKGEKEGQINILLLGIGGYGHEGPYLTDTMILAQIKPKTSEVTLVSIPRDYLSELPNNLGYRKINAVFAEGIARTQDFDTAGRWSAMSVERLSGQVVPYYAVIDFSGFEKAIDKIGGVEINIENSFTDAQFPDENLGFLSPIHFEKGMEIMNGKRALEFARSRHGDNNEGSDFKRGLRQQKVTQAFKDKLMSNNTFSNPSKINSLLNIFADNFHTNLGPGEILHLYNLSKNQNIQNFYSLNLGLETKLICPSLHETAGYILSPCPNSNEKNIASFFRNSFLLGKLAKESAVIWLADSVKNNIQKTKALDILHSAGLTVWELDFSKDNLDTTIVYAVNPKPATIEYINQNLNAKTVSLPPPQVKIDSSKVDIIVILGKNN